MIAAWLNCHYCLHMIFHMYILIIRILVEIHPLLRLMMNVHVDFVFLLLDVLFLKV